MSSQIAVAWQPIIDSSWVRFFKQNPGLNEADQELEKNHVALIVALTGQGQYDEAVIECGRMWRRENVRNDPTLKYAHGGCDHNPVIWVLSRIYGSVKYPNLWETCGNTCINPCFLIMQGMAADLATTERHELLEAFATVTTYWLGVKNNLMLGEAAKFGTRLLSKLEAVPTADSHTVLLLRNSLAAVFLRGPYENMGRPGIDSDPSWNTTWTQREAIIRAFLDSRNDDPLAPPNGKTLRLLYGFIDVGLSHQPDNSKVVDDLMQLYRHREIAYDENHATSMSFIAELFGEFVQLMRENRISLCTNEEHGLMFDLIDFCLANGKYDQAQVLTQEFMVVPGRIISTDPSTSTDVFSKWHAPTRSVQSLLSKHGSPGDDYYWTDSRLYTLPIKKIDTTPARIEDYFPKAPIKVTTAPGLELQLEISDDCLKDWKGRSDSQSLDEVTRQVKKSEIWCLLQKLHAAADWRILLGLDLQSHHQMCRNLNPMRENLRPHEEVCTYDMFGSSHVIWIFEEELIEAAVADGQDVGSPFTHVYRFFNVGSFETPCWMTIKFPQIDGKDGNQPSACQHGTFYPTKQSFGYKLNVQSGHQEEQLRIQCVMSEDSELGDRNETQPGVLLTVPIIAYNHFETLRSYRYGMTYREYMDMFRGSLSGSTFLKYSEGPLHSRSLLLRRGPRPVHPVWNLLRADKSPDDIKAEDLELSLTRGFFNGVPSGSVVLDTTGNEHAYGLVSTAWNDWKTYVLHPVPNDFASKAKLLGVQSSSVLGYIIGSWTEHDLSAQAPGIRLLVVEADLRFRGERVNFAMNACLYPGNSKTLSMHEQRIFCGRLNPTFFRYAPTRFSNRVGRTKSSKKVERKREPDFRFLYSYQAAQQPLQEAESADLPTEPYSSDEFWDEMMAREVWDRMVEAQQPMTAPDPRIEEYARWRQREEQRRRDWDDARDVNGVVFRKDSTAEHGQLFAGIVSMFRRR